MSKKLIAVASAAALALTALVGVAPASATPTIAYKAGGANISSGTTVGTGSGTTAEPYLITVPWDNTLVLGANVGAARVIEVAVSNIGVGDKVTVSTTGKALVTDELVPTATSFVDVTKIGKTSVTDTVETGAVSSLYVYTTSTDVATFSVTVTKTTAGVTTTETATKVMKGVAGPAYNMSVVSPSTLAKGAKSTLVATVTDVFGNDTTVNNVVRITTFDYATGTVATADATRVDSKKVSEYEWTSPSSDAIALSLKLNSDPAHVVGFAKAKKFVAATVNSAGVSSQVAALTAQLAESRSKATSVTKKKYNTLVRKWNAAFPSQKVALKK